MRRLCLVASLLVCATRDAAGGTDDPGIEFFESRVRPLLAEHCYGCHSAKAEKLKAGLWVDSREGLLKGGESGPAVVAGKPEQSRLIEAVRYSSPELQMPPRGRLSDEQVAALVRWVELGAPWSDGVQATAPTGRSDMGQRRATHWAWRPVRASAPPTVEDERWVRTRVDRFILARLEAAGLRPAPPADRRSLLRRIHFALLGLPPTPEEVDDFLEDQAPDALERVVDRLLASPHFGERWARHWMDLVRYSDTLGNEADMPIPNSWRYRDYLVRAFNADLPYDRFILEHIGGDLLDEPRRLSDGGDNESVLGTAFFWMSEGKRSPVDLRQAQADSFDNRLDVMGKAFLGLTVACARCHDHKFDPITQEDYYGLYGYLKSSRYTQTLLNRIELDDAAARMAAIRAEIGRASGAAWARHAAMIPRYLLAALRVRSDADVPRISRGEGLRPDRLRLWAKAANESAPGPGHPMFTWRRIADLGSEPTSEAVAARWREIQAETHAATHIRTRRDEDIVLADFGRSGFRGWFVEDQAFGAAPLRPGEILLGMEAARPVASLARGGAWAHSGHLSRRLQGTLRSPSFSLDRRFLHVLAAGRASRVNVVIEHFVMIQDPLYGRLRLILNDDAPRWHTFDLEMWRGRRAYLEFADTTTQDLHDMGPPAGPGADGYVTVGNVLLSDRGPPSLSSTVTAIGLIGDAPVDSPRALAERYGRAVSASLAALADGSLPGRSDAESRSVLLAWLVERGLLELDESATGPIGALLESFRKIEARLPVPRRAPAMTEGTPEDERVFLRGNPKTVGPVVPRRMLSALASDGGSPSRAVGSGRLHLARRIADPANPLTARVAVNRVWHHLFGRGLVPTVDNFGALGDRPSHPELLDDLADRFVHDGWSIKRMVRELVLSSTFRMASTCSPEAEAADPDNRRLHRSFVRRLEAEAIRDAILAVSGRLEGRMGGPGVEVYLTPFMDNYTASYGRPKDSGPLDGDGRRSLYLNVRRNFLTPLLAAFDMPAPLVTAGRRDVSNVPAQALILMNDPFVAQQARRWAVRMLAIEGLDVRDRVRRMYREAYGRPPSEAELKAALRFLESHAGELGVPLDRCGDDERVWADFAHVLFNVKEFIFLK
jgi:Protein of unknown function (DUF1553)/Protein of unknown function (DUF1549)/Planctomycete cytochrome C